MESCGENDGTKAMSQGQHTGENLARPVHSDSSQCLSVFWVWRSNLLYENFMACIRGEREVQRVLHLLFLKFLQLKMFQVPKHHILDLNLMLLCLFLNFKLEVDQLASGKQNLSHQLMYVIDFYFFRIICIWFIICCIFIFLVFCYTYLFLSIIKYKHSGTDLSEIIA